MRNVESVWHMITTYMGATDYLAIFLICVIFVFYRVGYKHRQEIMIISILSFLLIFNDYAWRFVGKVMESLTYYRFLWIVPILPVIAYSMGAVIDGLTKKIETIFVVLLFALIVFLRGESYMHKDALQLPETAYGISESAVEMCDIIQKDKKTDYPVVAFDIIMTMQSRIYDPTIKWAIKKKDFDRLYPQGIYDRERGTELTVVLFEAVVMGVKGDQNLLKQALDKKKVDYLVIESKLDMDGYLAELQCNVVGRTSTHTVYAYEFID